MTERLNAEDPDRIDADEFQRLFSFPVKGAPA